jgi:hypothetical protein
MMSDPRFNVSALVFGEPMIGEMCSASFFLLAATLAPVDGMGQGAAIPKNLSLSPSALIAGFAHWIC